MTESENDLKAAEFYDSVEIRADPHNHCVPLLDVIHPEPKHAYLIFPTMREFNDPDFETLGEILESIKQMLEVSLNHFYIRGKVMSTRTGS